MADRVRLLLDDPGYVRIAPVSYLGGDRFEAYRSAVEGARFIPPKKANVAPLDKVHQILVRLRDAGFELVKPDADVTRALQGRHITNWLDLKAAQERIDAIDAELHKRTGHRLFNYQRTGVQWLSYRYCALLGDDPGTGKEQPVSEPVLTPSGWKPIGSLKRGSYVVGSNGKPVRVSGVFPQGRKDVYRVTMTNGATTRCGLEHLWKVQSKKDRRERKDGQVLSLREILQQGVRASDGHSRWFVPILKSPVVFEGQQEDLPLHPYAMGALLANASFINPGTVVHSGTEEQRRVLRRFIRDRFELRPCSDACSFRIVQKGYKRENHAGPRAGYMRQALESFGLDKKRSWEKHVPDVYLYGSVEERKLLLAGLMDNDGTVAPNGTDVEYNTTSQALASALVFLVRSLGGIATINTRIPYYTYKGKRKAGRTDYRVRPVLPFNPFLVASKKKRFRLHTKYQPIHAIESVVKEGREESVCIRVAAEDRLYVTNDFILTHNTLQSIAAMPANVPMLVVGPAAAKGEWTAEMERWRPQIPVRMLSGRGSFRWPVPGELVVTNYDILPDVHDRTVECPHCGARFGPDAEFWQKLEIVRKATKPEKGKPGKPTPEVRRCSECRKEIALRPRCDGMRPANPCKGCHEEVDFTATEVRTVVRGHEPDCTGFEPDEDRERCPGCHPILRSAPKGIVAVADEVHFLKNPQALRTIRMRGIFDSVRSVEGRTIGLSGTPLENEPPELWTVLSVLGLAQEAFGTYQNFVTLFGGTPKMFGRPGERRRAGYDWGTASPEVPDRLRRVMLRRTKADVLPELPPKLHKRILVDLDAKAIRACDAFLKEYGGIEKITELLQAEKLSIDSFSKVGRILDAAKIPSLMDYVEDYEARGEPIVVFSMFRPSIDFLGQRSGWKTITGDVESGAKRTAIKDEFQAGKLRGLACTIQASGVAITLTKATTCIFVTRSFKPGQNTQAADRLQRIGAEGNAEGNILIVSLEARHPLEKRMQEVLDRKERIIRGSVDAASVGDDAPPCSNQDFEGELRRMREEIACGRAVRRAAEAPEEAAAIETLARAPDGERLAAQLVEEASIVGLSEAQWTLARKLAAEGGS